jgi:hypothetical protein
VTFRLAQPAPNVDAVGAWVEVTAGGRSMRREITVGGGHVSSQAGWIHFGIGAATDAEVRVKWPGGDWSQPMPVAGDGFYVIDRMSGTAKAWSRAGN